MHTPHYFFVRLSTSLHPFFAPRRFRGLRGCATRTQTSSTVVNAATTRVETRFNKTNRESERQSESPPPHTRNTHVRARRLCHREQGAPPQPRTPDHNLAGTRHASSFGNHIRRTGRSCACPARRHAWEGGRRVQSFPLGRMLPQGVRGAQQASMLAGIPDL